MTKYFHDPTERCSHGLPIYPRIVRCFDCEIAKMEEKITDANMTLNMLKLKLRRILEEQREAEKE